MKQKIVIRVSMHDEKCRSKALKIAVGMCGVEAAALKGEEKDQVEVVGVGIDSVKLTRRLRKNFSHAEIVSVGEDKKEDKKSDLAAMATVMGWVTPPCYGYPQYNCCAVADPIHSSPCTIL